MTEQIIGAAVMILFGALAGGLTNTVAIWMLFHPYRPPELLGRTMSLLHGAIPKNQPRLAKAIGRTVGERLLTEEDLTQVLSAGEFREAFDDRLSSFIEVMLHQERGPLRDLIPAAARDDIESLIVESIDRAVDRLETHLQTDEFQRQVEERAGDLLDAVKDEPVADVLTPAREAMLTEAVADWLRDLVESEGFRGTVEEYLRRNTERFLAPERTFEEILPIGLVASLEKAVASYLPLAIRRLGGLLEDPATRARFQRTVHDLLHRFLQDLRFHQRVVAKLVMTDETVDRVLGTIEREGAERLGEMLREPEIQAAMSRGVNDAFVDLLRRPVSSILGQPGDDNVIEAIDTITDWLVDLGQDPRTRNFLVERLDLAMDKAGTRTWGDVLGGLPSDRVATWLVAAARTDSAGRAIRSTLHKLVDGLLDRPIGRPADWFPEGSPQRIERALGDSLWAWVETQIPEVVRRIDISRRVEEKVLEFPTPKMEEIVRRVTDRELRLIVKLGYVLGAFVGSILVIVNAIMPWVIGLVRGTGG